MRLNRSIPVIMILFLCFLSCATADKKDSSPGKEGIAQKPVSINIDDSHSINMDLQGWNIATKREEMPSFIRDLDDRIRESGGRLILFGLNVGTLTGIRIIVEKTDMDNRSYYEALKFVNQAAIEDFTECENRKYGNSIGVEWFYTAKGQPYRYYEYLTRNNIYNVRITFWANAQIFEQRKSQIIHILDSIELVNPFMSAGI